MLVDRQLLMADSQAPTTVGGTDSTDTIDFGSVGDKGIGTQLWSVLTVTQTVTSGGAATVQFKLVTDDASNFPSAATLWDSGALAIAGLTAGKVFAVPLPPGVERYLKATYTIGTAALTAGKFHWAIVRDVDLQKIYPRASFGVA